MIWLLPGGHFDPATNGTAAFLGPYRTQPCPALRRGRGAPTTAGTGQAGADRLALHLCVGAVC
jgi:hypothetical protein